MRFLLVGLWVACAAMWHLACTGEVAGRVDAGIDARADPDGGDPGGDPGGGPAGDEPLEGECNDGLDNDGDGLTDWQMDPGCYGAADRTEGSPLPQDRQDGWTVFEPGPDSRLVYVSSSGGDDGRDGSSPEQAVRSLARGIELVRDGQHDFLLLKRGDVFRDEVFGRFKSGLDAERRLVVASYGAATERPRLEVSDHALDHDGHPRSHLAFVGLEILAYPMDPDHSDFSGENVSGGFRLVGAGDDILIEDCLFRFCELVVQSYGGDVYRNVEIRRNIVTTNYAHGTCPSNSQNRPSGIFASHVHGLSIEENLWDHNGWNEEVATACATMYNHNMYLSGGYDLTVRGNLILRASSMGIKMRSDTTGDFDGIIITDNLFVEGEIGLGIGGNTDAPLRFVHVEIQGNVFTHIGRTRPTDRSFAWYLGVSDNQRAHIADNLFIHQPWFDNAYGISLGGGTAQEVTVEDNWFYGLRRRHLRVEALTGWSDVLVRGNNFLDTDLGAAMVVHDGGFEHVIYTGNHYSSSAADDAWFEIDGAGQSLDGWRAASGETDADTEVPVPPAPGRNLETYCTEVLGLSADIAAFAEAAGRQSRHAWDPALTATAVNDYIRAGFLQ